uniref:Tetraspanin n=1 Tax=Phallusia mammillata TaxID=59560 RepID=A0A6F9D870_9ASCI|nr:CD63 antigen [Phallusia mammillata]
MKKGCVDCSRYSLVVINVVFLIFGLLLVALGAFIVAVPATNYVITVSSTDVTTEQIWNASMLVIATGGFIMLIALIHCCGALNSSSCIMMGVSIFTGVLLVFEITLVVLGFLFSTQIGQHIVKELSYSLYDYKGDNATDPVSVGWREIQRKFKCCGIDTDQGYTNHTNVNISAADVGSWWYRNVGSTMGQEWPDSCCVQNKFGEANNTVCHRTVAEGNPDLYTNGCYEQVLRFLQVNMGLISVICIVIFVVEIASIVVSCKLYKVFKSPQFQKL